MPDPLHLCGDWGTLALLPVTLFQNWLLRNASISNGSLNQCHRRDSNFEAIQVWNVFDLSSSAWIRKPVAESDICCLLSISFPGLQSDIYGRILIPFPTSMKASWDDIADGIVRHNDKYCHFLGHLNKRDANTVASKLFLIRWRWPPPNRHCENTPLTWSTLSTST